MPFLTQGSTNWKFIGIVAVLAMVVGGGTLWFTEQQKLKNIQPFQLSEIEESEMREPEVSLLSECDEISDKIDKASCYARVAVVEEDLSICDRIQNQDIKNNCYDEVKLTGRPIWDEVLQESCWNRYEGEIFGNTIKPVKLINARYKGSNYYFHPDEQTKIIFEEESIVLEKNGSRKIIKDDIRLYRWSDYDFYSLVKLWEDAKEDHCNHFVVLSTTEPNIFLISGYEWIVGGGSYQGNYYFYLDVEKGEIILPVEFTHGIGSIMSGYQESYSIYIDTDNEPALYIEVSCDGRVIGDSSLKHKYEIYDALISISVDNKIIYTDSLENMCGQRDFKTFFNGPNQDFSGFYFTVANMDEYSGAQKIQYFFNLRDRKIKELEQIIEISIDEEIKKIDKIQLPVDEEGAKMIVKTFCEPKIFLGKYEYDEITTIREDHWWWIPIFDVGCLHGAEIHLQTGYTYCGNELEEWERGGFSESFSDKDTADWEIYRDTEYRFEFKYPKDWKLTEQTTNFTEEDMAGTLKKIYLTSSIKWELPDFWGWGEEATAELVFTIFGEESRKEKWWGTDSCWKIIFPSGISAITSESVTDVAIQTFIYIPSFFDDQIFIKIFSFTDGSVWEIEEFKQVLSTFKFLE